MKSLIKQLLTPFILGLLVTLSLLWPMYIAPYFSHHDQVQIIRLHQMDKCIKDLQIPCRWVPDLGDEYGYPLFNYYAPLPYYYGEIFYALTGNLLFAAKMMFASALVGSYIFMFLLGRKWWGSWGGLLAGLFYSLAPYHSSLIYVRGAMGEVWGLMFIPALFWAITRLWRKVNIANLLLVALFIALILVSHNLSALIFLPIAAIFVLILGYYQNEHRKRFFSFALLAAVFGLVLSAFYWLPMVMEKDLVHVESTTAGYFSYTEHFKGLKKTLFERSWGWGDSIREVPGGPKDGMSYQIGWVHLVALLIAIWGAWLIRQKKPVVFSIIIFCLGLVVLSVFMIHPRSVLVWQLIPPLKYLQFPWRFLGVAMVATSFAAGSLASLDFDKKKIFYGSLIVLLVALNFSYFQPRELFYTPANDYLTGQLWKDQLHRAILDYLPIAAKEPPSTFTTVPYEILTGDTQINHFVKGSDWLRFQAVAKSHTIIRLSVYYFPNWKVFVDGKAAEIDYKNNLGLITIILGEGVHSVEARLYDTPIRSASNILSLLGMISFVAILLINNRRTKERLVYYFKAFNS